MQPHDRAPTVTGLPGVRLSSPVFTGAGLPRARDIMVRDVLTVEPSRPLTTAAEMMAHHKIGALPVIAPDGSILLSPHLDTDLRHKSRCSSGVASDKR